MVLSAWKYNALVEHPAYKNDKLFSTIQCIDQICSALLQGNYCLLHLISKRHLMQ